MNREALSEDQQLALVDLALLAMYADGHLASAEDDRVNRLLSDMGLTTRYDRGKCYDEAIGRIRECMQSSDATHARVLELARSFKTRDEQRQVIALLDDVLFADKDLASKESAYLVRVKEAFGM